MFNIDNRTIGLNQPPFIIAEISANHNGSLPRAFQTITMAKKCGAHAVKLQTYEADTMTIDCDQTDFLVRGGPWDGYKLYDLYKWAETPYKWHQALFAHARELGISIFSTPFDESAVDLLESLNAPAFKIASFEILDLPLIRYAAKTGKPMIISTGMASEDEIGDALEAAREGGCSDLAVLHCISSYPTPVEQINLSRIPALAKQFGVVVGLSDHTIGTTASIAATALGASIIEKHFTLSRADEGPDSHFSLEPGELTQLSNDSNDAWAALGDSGPQRPQSEEASQVFRRSLYFVKDLPSGHIVQAGDIRRIRPGMGLAPKYLQQLIGKQLKIPVRRGTATSWSLFNE
jgi:pseudaminic acid synthase